MVREGWKSRPKKANGPQAMLAGRCLCNWLEVLRELEAPIGAVCEFIIFSNLPASRFLRVAPGMFDTRRLWRNLAKIL